MAEGALTERQDERPRARLFTTRIGSIIGTPAYMSPEQVRGERIDARSDLYSAAVVFHELLGHEHYFSDRQTLDGMLDAIKSEEVGFVKLLTIGQVPPAELIHVLRKGLQKDPAQRFQSAADVIARLHAVLEGHAPVQCHFTLTKRVFREMGRLVDRSPFVAMFALIGICAAIVFSVVHLVRLAI